MVNIKRFSQGTAFYSKVFLEKNYAQINSNLKEIKQLTAAVTAEYLLPERSLNRSKILFISSCLYEYYQLIEDSLLNIAMVIDLWIPGSLDWHYRLIRLMLVPIPDKRPAIMSKRTALLLDDYLVLYLNFHRHVCKISLSKLGEMISNMAELSDRLEAELTCFIDLYFSGHN
jgi:hypothetical protein